MADLPTQGLLQQMNARPHSGEFLEVLGKRAAARWASGQHKTLTAAVTETVKQAQLSPEQVKRVVEFANTSAYLDEFKKEGAMHNVVDFHGGPADVSEILKDLNDGGGGSVFDTGSLDYSSPPSEKRASDERDEVVLLEAFGAEKTAEPLPYANPYSEAIELKDKLAGASEQLLAQTSGLEVMYADLADCLYNDVKQAALGGISLGRVAQAWQHVAPSDDYIKVAFELLTPRLLREGVFHSLEEMTASADKTASAGMVNPEHPLVVDFSEFCDTLAKLAETRAARTEILEHLVTLENYIKTAASTVGNIYRAANHAAEAAASRVGPFAEKHLGAVPGKLIGGAVEYSPQIGLGLGAMELNRRIDNSPSAPARAARATKNVVLRNIPGTQENLMEQYRLQSGQ